MTIPILQRLQIEKLGKYFDKLIKIFDGLDREWWIRFNDDSYTKYFFPDSGLDIMQKVYGKKLNDFEINFSVQKFEGRNVNRMYDWDFIIDIDECDLEQRKEICRKLLKLIDEFDLVYLVDNRMHIWFPSWIHSLIDKWHTMYNRDFAVYMKYFLEITAYIKNKANLDAGLWYVKRHKIRVPYTFHIEDNVMQVFVDSDFKPIKFSEFENVWLAKNLSNREIVRYNKNFGFFIEYAMESGKILYDGFHISDFKVDYVRTSSTGKRKLRPCFVYAINNIDDMPHEMRLALVYEAVCSGYKDVMQIADLFRKQKDFKLNVTLYYINYILKHSKFIKPYKCSTIARKGWCTKNKCSLYKRKVR
jgi:hypothetical protein